MLDVLPSASVKGVGAPIFSISRLNTRPVRAPVECFAAALAGIDA